VDAAARAAAANAASSSQQQWTPPPPRSHPPPAAAVGYNLPPPAGGARPLAICATPNCDYYANIRGMEIGCEGFCCWCCKETSLGLRRPWRPHGKWCQLDKQPW
jgi:hypothetical protein